ncbi:MAG: YciI family protein [Pseudomonadota bacterium]
MKFVILFEDNQNADPNIRKTYMPDHLTFLERHADEILSAGPLTDSSENGHGGLWIAQAETVKDVEDLVQKDPFWPTGLRKSFKILKWKQVFDCGKRLINPQA